MPRDRRSDVEVTDFPVFLTVPNDLAAVTRLAAPRVGSIAMSTR